MTLRDYFAAKAMHALIGAHGSSWMDGFDCQEIARGAYGMANAMLAERAK